MIQRMLLQFLRYRWFPVLGLVMGLVLSATYFIAHNPGETAAHLMAGCCVAVAFAGSYIGFYIHPYLAQPVSAFVPGFRKAHVVFALFLNAGLALLVTGVATWGGGPWTNASRVMAFAILWCFGSIWLGLAYVSRASEFVGSFAELYWLFVPWYPLWQFMPTRFMRPLYAAIAYDTKASTTVPVLLVGLLLNVFLATIVFAYGDVRRYRESLGAADSPQSLGPLAQRLFWKRTFARLDAIRHPMPADFVSQVRLFTLIRQQVPHLTLGGILLAGLCLWSYMVRGLPFEASPLMMGASSFMMGVVVAGMIGSHAADFRLMSRLPLRRREIVARYGAAAVMLAIEVWLTFVAALFVAALLPFGIGLKSFPSLSFLADSLATHFAVFGIVALVYSVQTSEAARGVAAFLLMIVLVVTAVIVPSSLFALTFALLAIGLLYVSSQNLCRAEID